MQTPPKMKLSKKANTEPEYEKASFFYFGATGVIYFTMFVWKPANRIYFEAIPKVCQQKIMSDSAYLRGSSFECGKFIRLENSQNFLYWHSSHCTFSSIKTTELYAIRFQVIEPTLCSSSCADHIYLEPFFYSNYYLRSIVSGTRLQSILDDVIEKRVPQNEARLFAYDIDPLEGFIKSEDTLRKRLYHGLDLVYDSVTDTSALYHTLSTDFFNNLCGKKVFDSITNTSPIPYLGVPDILVQVAKNRSSVMLIASGLTSEEDPSSSPDETSTVEVGHSTRQSC